MAKQKVRVEPDSIPELECRTCKRTKNYLEFGRKARFASRGGRHTECRECDAKRHPPKKREKAFARDFEGSNGEVMSQREVAAIMGIPQQTVDVTERRSLRKLRVLMDLLGFTAEDFSRYAT